MKYIDSLREGMRISEVYLCKSKQIAQTKAGKDYGNLVLQVRPEPLIPRSGT